jgi:hypothetical protein
MFHVIFTILLMPFKLAVLLLELLGRSLALMIGLIFFGIGALLCMIPFMILIGAPLCLLSGILVIKAL